MTSPAPSSASSISSDAIMNPLQGAADVSLNDTGQSILSGLKNFSDAMGPSHLGFLYNRWYQHPCADPALKSAKGPYGSQPEESSMLEELYPMAFGYLDQAAKRLDNLTQSAEALSSTAGSLNSGISSAWSDSAGQAAAGKFNDLGTDATNLSDATKTLAGAMHALWSNCRQAVVKLSQFVDGQSAGFMLGHGFMPTGNTPGPIMGLSFADMMGFDVGEQSAHIDMLNAALQPGNKVFYRNDFMTYFNTPLPPQVLSGMAGLSLGSYNGHTQYSNDVCNAMNDFANQYNATMTNFRSQVQATVNLVRSQMQTLNDMLASGSLNEDPFSNLAPPAPVPAATPPAVTTPSAAGAGSVGTGSAGGGFSGGGGASGAGAAGGGGSSGGTSAASFTPPPLSPSTAGAGAGGAATGAAGAGAAGAGGAAIPPLSATTTPSSVPGLSTGAGGVGAGGTTGTGVPGSSTGGTLPQRQPETVTVQNGSNQISMTSPNGQGTMKLTVDDGSGHPKTYDVNFGQGTTGTTGATAGGTGMPGLGGAGTAQPGALPASGVGQHSAGQLGGVGQVGGAGPVGAAPTGAAGAGFGPSGTVDHTGLAGAVGSADGAQQITPGPDGKAVIHDGNLTITATEPAGHSGQVQVTVDDGSGHPTTYTMDASGGTGAGAGVASVQPLAGADPTGASATPVGVDHSAATPTYQAPTPATPGVTPAAAGYTDPAAGQTGSPVPAGGGYADPSAGVVSGGYSSGSGGFVDPSSVAQPAAYSSSTTASSSWLGADTGGAGMASGPGGSVSGFSQSFDGATPMHSDLGGTVQHSGAADAGWPTQHDVGGPAGLANTDVTHAGAPGGAGLATGPGDLGGQTSQAGMPMMGGMGGGAAGGGVGGDIERGASQWRTQGRVFDDQSDNSTGWISGVLDDSGDQGR